MKTADLPTPTCFLVVSSLLLLSCGAGDRAAEQARDEQASKGSELEPENSSTLAQTAGEAMPFPEEPDFDAQISPFIRRIFQDKNGNLWFGTNGDGVCRYDGTSLDYFTIENGFGGSAVRAIVEDQAGVLWFGTSGGVSKYEGGRFSNFTEEDGLSSSDVWTLRIDREGTLWVGTYGGACRFDGASGRFTPFPLPPAPALDPLRGVTSLNIVHSILEDRAGNLWFAVGCGGVHRYDGTSLVSITEADGLCCNTVNDMLEDASGDLWFATHYHGVCRYDGESFVNVTEEEGLSGTEVWSLYQDSSGHLWFPSEGFGVYCYDGQSFTRYGQEQGLASHAVQCVFEDRDGRLWFGGWMGLYRFDGTSFVNVTKGGPWR